MLDIGAPREALLASEMARARAFSDLMSGTEAGPSGGEPPDCMTLAALDATLARIGGPVVEFFVLPDEVVVWIAGPGGDVTGHRLPVSSGALAAATAEFHRLVALPQLDRADRQAMDDTLRWLGTQLWSGPLEDLSDDPDVPLLLVPHGPLLAMPFAAVRDRRGRYLVERHPLASCPALHVMSQLLSRQAQRPHRQQPRCLAMVAPDPMPAPGLKPMDWTRANFAQIAGFYDPARTTVYAGPSCTLPSLHAGLADTDVIIFGTHAYAFGGASDDPLRSYIALAPSPGHSGLLVLPEIAELEFSADLAVLAACRTGGGRISSDGILGVSRTFLQRGVSALLMTLYDVGEKQGLDLVYRFHEHWRDSKVSIVRALCEAQRELLEDFRDQPRLWAGFTLFGAIDRAERT